MFSKYSPSENARLFVTEKMPRDGNLFDMPVESYIAGGRYSAHEVAIIREVISNILARRPSQDYTVGTSGMTVWLNIRRAHPKSFCLDLQLFWKEPPF